MGMNLICLNSGSKYLPVVRCALQRAEAINFECQFKSALLVSAISLELKVIEGKFYKV